MPKVWMLEKPTEKNVVRSLIREIRKHRESSKPQITPETEPRLTFTWPLSKERRNALEMMETGEIEPEKVIELLESEDFVVVEAGLNLLSTTSAEPGRLSRKVRKKLLSAIRDLGTDSGTPYETKERVVLAAANLGDGALLQEMFDHDSNRNVRTAALTALIGMGEKAMPILEKLIDKSPLKTKWQIIEALHCSKSRATADALERVIEKAAAMDEGGEITAQIAIWALGRMGEDGLPALSKLSRHENPSYRDKAAQSLGQIATTSDRAIDVLKTIRCNDPSERVRSTADNALATAESHRTQASAARRRGAAIQQRVPAKPEEYRPFLRKWLFASRKPWLATPYTKEVMQRVSAVGEITQELLKTHPHLIVIVLGSTEKGYYQAQTNMAKESDLDWIIIGEEKERAEIAAAFEKLAKKHNLKLCPTFYTDEGYYVTVKEAQKRAVSLFSGMFFGNREKLLELQMRTLQELDTEMWDRIRRCLQNIAEDIGKALPRFANLDTDELRRIRQYRTLLQIPPTLEETKKILARRIRKLKREDKQERSG